LALAATHTRRGAWAWRGGSGRRAQRTSAPAHQRTSAPAHQRTSAPAHSAHPHAAAECVQPEQHTHTVRIRPAGGRVDTAHTAKRSLSTPPRMRTAHTLHPTQGWPPRTRTLTFHPRVATVWSPHARAASPYTLPCVHFRATPLHLACACAHVLACRDVAAMYGRVPTRLAARSGRVGGGGYRRIIVPNRPRSSAPWLAVRALLGAARVTPRLSSRSRQPRLSSRSRRRRTAPRGEPADAGGSWRWRRSPACILLGM